MAQHGVPPLWSDTVRALRPDRSPHVMLSDIDALHALPEAVGTAAVSSLIKVPAPRRILTNFQHHTSALHGPHLLRRVVPILLLLSTRSLLRSHTRLL